MQVILHKTVFFGIRPKSNLSIVISVTKLFWQALKIVRYYKPERISGIYNFCEACDVGKGGKKIIVHANRRLNNNDMKLLFTL